ncbi:hypothetical protein JYQ62_36650 [Nostoc sp. UHCC 0702]|nr:hypothetical protein JYQ62_36650 [Nostoc sp. UHCC 0702]
MIHVGAIDELPQRAFDFASVLDPHFQKEMVSYHVRLIRSQLQAFALGVPVSYPSPKGRRVAKQSQSPCGCDRSTSLRSQLT